MLQAQPSAISPSEAIALLLKDTKENPTQARERFQAKFTNLHFQIASDNTPLLNSIGRTIMGVVVEIEANSSIPSSELYEIQKQLLTYKYLLERHESAA